MPPVNFLAIIIATISRFIIGYFWYSDSLFNRRWMKEAGLSESQIKKANMAQVMGFSFILALIICFSLAMFIGPNANLAFGTFAGFMAGFSYVAASMGIRYLFEQRSMALFLINAGYEIISYTVAGAIISALS